MSVELHSHRLAATVLNSAALQPDWNDILRVARDCPLFHGLPPAKHPGRDVNQQCMNAFFRHNLTKRGWLVEPLVDVNGKIRLKADFLKEVQVTGEPQSHATVQVEVQFGNNARLHSDLMKFQVAFELGRSDVGVLVLPVEALAKRIDSGVVSFEAAKRNLEIARNVVDGPIIVVGLGEDGRKKIDLAKLGYSRKDLAGNGKTIPQAFVEQNFPSRRAFKTP